MDAVTENEIVECW